jgi:hypothetical protein
VLGKLLAKSPRDFRDLEKAPPQNYAVLYATLQIIIYIGILYSVMYAQLRKVLLAHFLLGTHSFSSSARLPSAITLPFPVTTFCMSGPRNTTEEASCGRAPST